MFYAWLDSTLCQRYNVCIGDLVNAMVNVRWCGFSRTFQRYRKHSAAFVVACRLHQSRRCAGCGVAQSSYCGLVHPNAHAERRGVYLLCIFLSEGHHGQFQHRRSPHWAHTASSRPLCVSCPLCQYDLGPHVLLHWLQLQQGIAPSCRSAFILHWLLASVLEQRLFCF
jgi:hypothetical protein